DVLGIGVGPAHVGLKFLVAEEKLVGVHGPAFVECVLPEWHARSLRRGQRTPTIQRTSGTKGTAARAACPEFAQALRRLMACPTPYQRRSSKPSRDLDPRAAGQLAAAVPRWPIGGDVDDPHLRAICSSRTYLWHLTQFRVIST